MPRRTYRLSLPLQLRALLERGLRLDNVGGVHVGLVVLADAVNRPVDVMRRARFDQRQLAACPAGAPSPLSHIPLDALEAVELLLDLDFLVVQTGPNAFQAVMVGLSKAG